MVDKDKIDKKTKKPKKTKKEKEIEFLLVLESFNCPICKRITIKQEITNTDYRCISCNFFITEKALKEIFKEKDKEVGI